MATRTEPNLRLVNVSHDLVDDAGESAQRHKGEARDTEGTPASLAPVDVATGVSGEIRNDWKLAGHHNSALTSTLLGMPGFPAAKTSSSNSNKRTSTPSVLVDASQLFVSPDTVAAIEKVKADERERHGSRSQLFDTIIDGTPPIDARDTLIDGVAFPKVVDGNVVPISRKSKDKIEVPEKAIETVKLETPAHPAKWQEFEDLGLAPKPVTKTLQKLVVSTYRLLGFGILTIIVMVLIGYIATSTFYFLNKSWVTPVALSANDEKVVGLQSQLAGQLNERAKLVAELEQSERAIKAEQSFQLQFAKAIKHDLDGRRQALDRVKQLAQSAAMTRHEIRTTNGDYSSSTVSKMENEYSAGLIDRDSMLAGKFQLAQISNANLSLAERQAEFDQQAAELRAQTQSLDALLGDKAATSALSYDVLKIARDYETSKLALAQQMSNRERLKESIQRQDQIINGVNQSAYMRAIANNATVALVPYANLKNVSKGTPLYACKLNMVWCRQVGQVLDVLPGEIMVKQPNRESMVRGRMIEMKMTDPEAAQEEVLFAGGKPLGI